MTHTNLLKGLVGAGIKWRYSTGLDKWAKLRILWELNHIIKSGYVDYYLMAYWIFRHSAQDINYWTLGAASSSIICYCLGLTEPDPLRYRLHAELFVNEEPPRFMFDIELMRYDEFKERVEDIFAANYEEFDIVSMKDCFINNLWDSNWLSTENEREMPEDIEGEIALYALWYGSRQDLFEEYFLRKEGDLWTTTGIIQLDNILDSTYGLLIYQEQMLDILQQFFQVSPIEANRIRIAIQRKDEEQTKGYRALMFANMRNINTDDAEKAWEVLISNPKAYLKSHAVSRVLQSYDYNMPSISDSYFYRRRIKQIKKKLTSPKEVLYPFKDKMTGLYGYVNQSKKVVYPCQWRHIKLCSEAFVAVQDINGKWEFINMRGKVLMPVNSNQVIHVKCK